MTSADSPRQALSLAYTYLRAQLDEEDLPCPWERINGLLGNDGQWTDPAAAMDPSRSVGSSADAQELRLIADDLQWLLACEVPRLVVASSRDALWDAELAARTAAGLLTYHAAMAAHSPRRVARMLSIRDAMMADNLCALATREARTGPALVFAHNQHLHRGVSHWQLGDLDLPWHSAGALLATRLTNDYTVIGSAIGTGPRTRGSPSRPPTPSKGRSTRCRPARISCPPMTWPAPPTTPNLASSPRPAVSNNHGYFPLDPSALRDLDAVLFLRDVTERHPEPRE